MRLVWSTCNHSTASTRSLTPRPLPSHPLHTPSPPPLPDPRGGATSSKTIPQSRSLVEKQPACKSGACTRCTVTHVSNPLRPPVGGPTADYTTHLLHAACPRRWAPRLNYQQQFGSSLAGVTGCKRSAVLLLCCCEGGGRTRGKAGLHLLEENPQWETHRSVIQDFPW